MRPFDGFLDLDRVDPMPGNMADIVQIPIETFCAIQHSSSIYNYCIYILGSVALQSLLRAAR